MDDALGRRGRRPNGGGAPPSWFHADEHREADRLRLTEAGIAETVGRFRLVPQPETRLEASLLTFTHGSIGAMTGFLSPMGLERRGEDIGPADRDHLLLLRPVFGAVRVTQGGRTVRVDMGDAMLVALARPLGIDAAATGRLDLLRFPQAALGSAQDELDTILMRSVAKDATVLQLLSYYAGALLQQLIPLRTQAQVRTIVLHILDILGLLFQGERPAGPLFPAADRGVAARRLSALKADIEDHLNQPDLTLEAVAVRQAISPRYIQKLLRLEGTSFSAYVLERRLEEARRRLRWPEAADRTISSIAYEVGFGDLSYFNRRFRDKFGMSPSQCRRL